MDSDARDRESLRKKIEICIDPLDPKKHPRSIVNIATGQLAGDTVNVDRSIERGTEAMKQFESKWPTGFDEKISKVVETQAAGKKHLKVGNTKVFDTNLIYTRVIGLQASSRDIDINELLAHV